MSLLRPDNVHASRRNELFRSLLSVLVCLALMGVSSRTTWLSPLQDALYEWFYSPIHRTIQAPLRWSATKVARWSADREALAAAKRLARENRELRAKVQLMAHYQAENRRLHMLMNSVALVSEPVLVAELDDTQIEGYREEVTINKGRTDGVYERQPVIDPFGLVGQVIRVYPHRAVVMLIGDGRSRVPVYVERTRQRTLVAGSTRVGVLDIPLLRLGSDIHIGDRLISSGLGGIFPRGYPVAKILSIERDQRDSFLSIRLQPLAHLGSLLEVLLLDRAVATNASAGNLRIPVGPPRPPENDTRDGQERTH